MKSHTMYHNTGVSKAHLFVCEVVLIKKNKKNILGPHFFSFSTIDSSVTRIQCTSGVTVQPDVHDVPTWVSSIYDFLIGTQNIQKCNEALSFEWHMSNTCYCSKIEMFYVLNTVNNLFEKYSVKRCQLIVTNA